MVSLDQLHELGTELEMWLRMRVHPIAVKMLKDRNEVPADTVIPTRDWGHKFALCQSFAKSQRDGLSIAMFKEDMWCFEPVEGLGLGERVPLFLEGHHRYPDSVRDLKAAAEWCRNMPHLDYGQYQGIVSAPIGTCSFIPDVIVMHVNGMQSSQLLIVKNWIDGKDIHAQLSGHAACVYAVVPALKERTCYVAIPCKGDRRLAFAQDDEILFSLLPELLPDFVEGARFLQEHEWGIPMIQEYKEEYNLKPKYAEVGELLGMDMTQSPPRKQKFQRF
ncbi:MAG: DUF169 domain-containing protein [Chloroflexota bacterium]